MRTFTKDTALFENGRAQRDTRDVARFGMARERQGHVWYLCINF